MLLHTSEVHKHNYLQRERGRSSHHKVLNAWELWSSLQGSWVPRTFQMPRIAEKPCLCTYVVCDRGSCTGADNNCNVSVDRVNALWMHCQVDFWVMVFETGLNPTVVLAIKPFQPQFHSHCFLGGAKAWDSELRLKLRFSDVKSCFLAT